MEMPKLSPDVAALNPSLSGESTKTVPASKYHNVRQELRGMTFQSGHEASGVNSLILQEEQHLIFGLRLQVRFPLAGGVTYVADACYLDDNLVSHVVDFKGYKTNEFKLKAKLFKARYGRDIELL